MSNNNSIVVIIYYVMRVLTDNILVSSLLSLKAEKKKINHFSSCLDT